MYKLSLPRPTYDLAQEAQGRGSRGIGSREAETSASIVRTGLLNCCVTFACSHYPRAIRVQFLTFQFTRIRAQASCFRSMNLPLNAGAGSPALTYMNLEGPSTKCLFGYYRGNSISDCSPGPQGTAPFSLGVVSRTGGALRDAGHPWQGGFRCSILAPEPSKVIHRGADRMRCRFNLLILRLKLLGLKLQKLIPGWVS